MSLLPTPASQIKPSEFSYSTNLKFNRAGLASVYLEKGFKPLEITLNQALYYSVRTYPEWQKARLKVLPTAQDAAGLEKLLKHVRQLAEERYALNSGKFIEIKDPFYQEGADRFVSIDWPKMYDDNQGFFGMVQVAHPKRGVFPLNEPLQLEALELNNKTIAQMVVKPKVWVRQENDKMVFGIHFALQSLSV